MDNSVFALTDKVAIITGGGTGIGRSIAIEFARVGANVVLASRKIENLEKVAGEVRTLGKRALAIATDVRKPEDVDNMVKKLVVRRRGKYDSSIGLFCIRLCRAHIVKCAPRYPMEYVSMLAT